MPTFQIGGPDHQAATQRLALLRGFAINAYAGLEQSLCLALSHVGDMPPATAATIFFKVTNTRSRNEIIITLKKRKYGDRHNFFWNSIFKEVGRLDEKGTASSIGMVLLKLVGTKPLRRLSRI